MWLLLAVLVIGPFVCLVIALLVSAVLAVWPVKPRDRHH
jgi:hypothetical protein